MIGLIPAAGLGTRLKELTKDTPKEMLPVGGKPSIEYVLDQFKQAGITKIFIIVGPQKSKILDGLGNGSKLGFEIGYLYQEKAEGLGRAIYEGKNFINEDFAVVLADNLLFPNTLLKDVVAEHETSGAEITLVGREVDDPSRFGVIESADGKVTGLEEKPPEPKTKNAVVGMYVFKPSIFEAIERTEPGAKGEYQITDSIKLMLEEWKNIRVVKHEGDWIDIGTEESYAEANKRLGETKNG
jgi:glucose-1-phosphate thymidylyltransferase